jgi:hypothetical protein
MACVITRSTNLTMGAEFASASSLELFGFCEAELPKISSMLGQPGAVMFVDQRLHLSCCERRRARCALPRPKRRSSSKLRVERIRESDVQALAV